MCISHYDYVASPEHRCHDTLPAVAGRQREWGTSSVLANWQRWAAMAVSLLGVQLHTFVGMDTGGKAIYCSVRPALGSLSASGIPPRAFSFILHSHLCCVVLACAVCVICMALCCSFRMGIIMDHIIFKPPPSPQNRYSTPELSRH